MNNRPIVVTAALIASIAACKPTTTEPATLLRPVRYATVDTSPSNAARTFAGRVEAAERVERSFLVTGQVERVRVRVGQPVKKGLILAELDATDFKLKKREALASLRQAQAQLQNAEATYQRTRRLYETRTASRQDYDAARAARKSATAQVDSVRERLALIRRQIAYCRLKTTFDGVVADVKLDVGETARAGATALVLQAGKALDVRIDVPEQAVAGIKVGDRVEVRFPAFAGVEVDAVVRTIGTESTSSATFEVHARLESNPESKLRPGMAAEIQLSPEPSAARITVPSVAVGEDVDGRFVLVLDDVNQGRGRVRRQPVKVGRFRSGRFEVVDGLRAGEVIVTAGLGTLREGTEVKIPAAR